MGERSHKSPAVKKKGFLLQKHNKRPRAVFHTRSTGVDIRSLRGQSHKALLTRPRTLGTVGTLG